MKSFKHFVNEHLDESKKKKKKHHFYGFISPYRFYGTCPRCFAPQGSPCHENGTEIGIPHTERDCGYTSASGDSFASAPAESPDAAGGDGGGAAS